MLHCFILFESQRRGESQIWVRHSWSKALFAFLRTCVCINLIENNSSIISIMFQEFLCHFIWYIHSWMYFFVYPLTVPYFISVASFIVSPWLYLLMHSCLNYASCLFIDVTCLQIWASKIQDYDPPKFRECPLLCRWFMPPNYNCFPWKLAFALKKKTVHKLGFAGMWMVSKEYVCS